MTIFEIQALIENVNDAVDEELVARGPDNHDSIAMDKDEFDECGEDVFGDDWDEVKDHILVKPGNKVAHPMFFKVSGTRDVKLPNWRHSRPIPFDRVLYPDYFTFLLQLQIFPAAGERWVTIEPGGVDGVDGRARVRVRTERLRVP